MRTSVKKPPSYPALLLTQNKHRFYFTTIPIDDLFPSCFVARRGEDPISGFQRTLTEARANDIALYLSAGDGSIPTNIVLSAQVVAEFGYSRKTKSVSFKRRPSAFLVLDGQHRLWGYDKCKVRHRVPVAIYEGLSRAEEAKLFIDINTNQRGVPATLLLDIKLLAEIETKQETILRDLFNRLNEDSKSPVSGKLSAAKSVVKKISRVTFNKALGPVLSGSVLLGTDPESRYGLIRNYLNAFDAELDDKRWLVRAAYFESIFDIFDEVVRTTKSSRGNVKQENLQEILRPVAKLDLSQGKVTKTAIAAAMKATLRQGIAISPDDI